MFRIASIVFLLILSTGSNAQIWKKKTEKKSDSTAVQEESTKEEKKGGGGNLFQKAIAKMSKGAAKMGGAMTGTTTSTASLESVEPMVFFNSNLVPKEVATIDQDFFNGWKEGGDFLGVMFLPKDKSFFYKIDGNVNFDGTKTEYQSTGLYTKIFGEAKQERVFEVQTSSGQKARFNLKAKKNNIHLVSVNGKTSGAEIDMSKDFTVQVKNFSTNPGALIRLQITGQTIGLRSWYDLGYFKPAATITIPGYILKHANGKNIKFKNAYLQVSDAELMEAKDESGFYKEPLRYYSGTSSVLPIKITNEADLFEGFKINESKSFSLGKMTAEFVKGNATTSRPFAHATTVAASTFAIKGTTYYYDQKENKFLETKETKTIEFPQIPDEKLDAILERMYANISTILKDELGVKILPAETVANTKEFEDIAPFTNKDNNTEEHFSRAYRRLRPMAMIVPLATTYKGEMALFKAAGANALLKVVLNLQVSWDGKAIMQPILDVELLGEKNGGDFAIMPTKYFTAKITGEGYKIKGGKAVTDQVIEEIVRLDDLMTMLRGGIQQLKSKEKQNGEYERIWDLQK